ncbi:hypothetical protein PHYPSEUDO_005763 [Phytophthora pseudosyringae]|uniref:Uncharacterized protein n=1 Tax=Phytophthora pseudosyringae TaxID=221518 RepID=A0A8T1VQH6_9STRA|nr:hypothetical protein PHYPSEUDO_005763 [Phytophthora pseudosyringae]
MAPIAPLPASDDVTVVFFPSKDEHKTQLVDQRASLQHKIVMGILYTLVSSGCVYGCVAAVTFFGDLFTLLLNDPVRLSKAVGEALNAGRRSQHQLRVWTAPRSDSDVVVKRI